MPNKTTPEKNCRKLSGDAVGKKRKNALASPGNESCQDSISTTHTSASSATPCTHVEPSTPTTRTSQRGKKRNSCKANKGLRHFSMQVCKKVEEKGLTSYNEVADELVEEFFREQEKLQNKLSASDASVDASSKAKGKTQVYDEKNIRRRVYDALNVLMAMDIIEKDKKEIRWKGLPHRSNQETESLHDERARRIEEVKRKRESLKELVVQNICFTNLVNRNRARYVSQQQSPESVSLPFIVVNTSNQTTINCEINPERTDVFFQFSKSFEINDDNKILKRLNLHKMGEEEMSHVLNPGINDYCRRFGLLKDCIEQPRTPAPQLNPRPIHMNRHRAQTGRDLMQGSISAPTGNDHRSNQRSRSIYQNQPMPIPKMSHDRSRSDPVIQRSYPPFHTPDHTIHQFDGRHSSGNNTPLSGVPSMRNDQHLQRVPSTRRY